MTSTLRIASIRTMTNVILDLMVFRFKKICTNLPESDYLCPKEPSSAHNFADFIPVSLGQSSPIYSFIVSMSLNPVIFMMSMMFAATFLMIILPFFLSVMRFCDISRTRRPALDT